MLTIRPIATADAAAFVALHGRCDAAAAQALIAESQAAFGGAEVMPQRHVFVLEAQGRLLGAATLAGSIGLDLPRHCYRTGVVVHASAELKMFNRAATLLLCNDTTGCAELGVPLMASSDPGIAPQRLLVEAVLLHVARHPDRFAPTLIAELPGVVHAGGGAPFWEGLGRHFHAGALPRDDAFFPSPERSHIARLMPKHPLYASFLSPEAQACIGARSFAARPLAEALQVQGLRARGRIGLFDGGAIVEAEVADLAVQRRRRTFVAQERAAAGSAACVVAGFGPQGLHAALVQGRPDDGVLGLEAATLRALGVEPGQALEVLRQGDAD